jgi:hypothetical protein
MSSNNQTPNMPVFIYPSGNYVNVNTLPQNTVYKWIDSLGGQQMTAPAKMGDKRPDGKRGHGGVYTNVDDTPTVEYHGYGKR